MYKSYGVKHSALYALVTCILYACSDEWHQSFVSGRSPQITDICIDTCGALSLILLNIGLFDGNHPKNSFKIDNYMNYATILLVIT